MIDDTLAGKIILAEQLGKKKNYFKAPKSDVDCTRVTITNQMSNTHTVLK